MPNGRPLERIGVSLGLVRRRATVRGRGLDPYGTLPGRASVRVPRLADEHELQTELVR